MTGAAFPAARLVLATLLLATLLLAILLLAILLRGAGPRRGRFCSIEPPARGGWPAARGGALRGGTAPGWGAL